MSDLETIAKDEKLDLFFHGQLSAMIAFMHLYTSDNEFTWTKASKLAAEGVRRGDYLAEKLRKWTWAYLDNNRCLPVNRYGLSCMSIIKDEDISAEIQAHLQSLRREYLSAQDVLEYVNRPEVLAQLGRKSTKPISLRSAQRWMHSIGLHYGKAPNGMYVDGHECEDVVEYRQNVFLPFMAQCKKDMGYEEGSDSPIAPDGKLFPKLILVTHDESTFYANDQCKTKWYDPSQPSKPQPKGEGTSIRVSDFCVLQIGFLHASDG